MIPPSMMAGARAAQMMPGVYPMIGPAGPMMHWPAPYDMGNAGQAPQPMMSRRPHSTPQSRVRVLQLPLPERTKPSYTLPLPNDCEGLVFAIEGKFNCGDDMVCDAAARILHVVSERAEKVLAAHLESNAQQLNRPKARLQRLKVLEGSWISSTYLAKNLISVANKLLDEVEATKARVSGPSTSLESSTALLEWIEYRVRAKIQTLSSIIQTLERWIALRHCLGLLEKPKPATIKASVNAGSTPSRRSQSSIFVDAAMAPRSVGRPRLRPLISIGELVDSVHAGNGALPLPKPLPRQNNFEALEKLVCRLNLQWHDAFVAAERKTQEALAADDDNLYKSEETHGALTKEGVSIFCDFDHPLSRNVFRSHELFRDSEQGQLFMDALKEAEFAIWREQRRPSEQRRPDAGEECVSTNSSAVRMSRTSSLTGGMAEELSSVSYAFPNSKSIDRIELERQANLLHTKDMATKYPSLNLMNQIMDNCAKIAAQLSTCGSEIVGPDFITRSADCWDLMMQASPNSPCPKLLYSIGPSYIQGVLSFAWKRGLQDAVKGHPKFVALSFNLSIFVMRSFGLMLVNQMFPSVSPKVAKALQSRHPMLTSDVMLVELGLTEAAILVLLIGSDELANFAAVAVEVGVSLLDLCESLLLCTFGAAVVCGRVRGLVCERAHSSKSNFNSAADNQTLRVLLSSLSPNIQESVANAIRKKRPGFEQNEINSPKPLGRPSLERRSSPQILPGSYTHQQAFEFTDTNSVLFDTLQERLGPANGSDEWFQVYSDIVHTSLSVFMSLSEDHDEVGDFIKSSSMAFVEIAYLTRSPVIARAVAAILKGGSPAASSFSDNDEDADEQFDEYLQNRENFDTNNHNPNSSSILMARSTVSGPGGYESGPTANLHV